MKTNHAIKSLIKLSSPIMLGQIGQMLIGAGDVYIASLYSTNSVAAIGVASGVFNPFFLFGIGLMMGVSPSIAYIRGQNTDQSNALSTIIIYALISGLIMTGSILAVSQFVPLMGFDPSITPSIQEYLNIVCWSVPFAIIFQGIKEYLQAYEEVFLPNFLNIMAVFLNLATNYVLVFGFGDFKGLGEIGLAIASLSIRVILCFAILVYVFKKKNLSEFSAKLFKTLYRFSLPIAFMFFLEVLAFCTVTILSGQISIVAAAANNIIMTLASIAFMVPLSLSSAVAVKVGNAFGRNNIQEMTAYYRAVVIIGFVFILFSSGCFFLFPENIMKFVTQDSSVIELGVTLLFIVAIFQLSDSSQVIFAGVLRGLKHTKISSLIIFIGYWVIGIPFGYYLAFKANQGAEGLWVGLAVSLSICALLLAIFSLSTMRKFEANMTKL